MKDEDIDRVLGEAAAASSGPDPAVVERICRAMESSIAPVQPLPSRWILTSRAAICCAAIAAAGAAILGLHGISAMDAVKIAVIFPVVVGLIWFAAAVSVREMLPGTRRQVPTWSLPVAASAALAGVFPFVFSDYGTERFIAQGIRCLVAGLVQAVPAAAFVYWILRRGFATNVRAAAMAQGVLAGMAGILMLELHCANFEVLHSMLWHTAVLPLSGIGGVVLVRLLRRG